MSFSLCSCFFRLILQDPLGDEAVEELDEGSEAERADEGTQTHKTAQEPAEQGAEGVGEDAAAEVLEVRVVPHVKAVTAIDASCTLRMLPAKKSKPPSSARHKIIPTSGFSSAVMLST